MNAKILFTIMVVVVGITGCSKDSTSMLGNSQTVNFTIDPKDGAAGVRIDAGITLSFAKSVDRAVVEKNLHLISELAMTDSLCPISDSMGHGMMVYAMMDSVKMNHLMDRHSSQGKFNWNGDSTRCTFTPDSMMYSNMEYMIHMSGEMMRMMANRMGDDMGMMGGHGSISMKDDMVYHFRTMDTTNTGSGHDGHH